MGRRLDFEMRCWSTECNRFCSHFNCY